MESTARETGMSWWLLQRKHKQIPYQHSRTASLSSPRVCCPWPGLPRSARFVSCKRAKDHGRSEALCSQTARTPAGIYLSVMDYAHGLRSGCLRWRCLSSDWRCLRIRIRSMSTRRESKLPVTGWKALMIGPSRSEHLTIAVWHYCSPPFAAMSPPRDGDH